MSNFDVVKQYIEERKVTPLAEVPFALIRELRSADVQTNMSDYVLGQLLVDRMYQYENNGYCHISNEVGEAFYGRALNWMFVMFSVDYVDSYYILDYSTIRCLGERECLDKLSTLRSIIDVEDHKNAVVEESEGGYFELLVSMLRAADDAGFAVGALCESAYSHLCEKFPETIESISTISGFDYLGYGTAPDES